MQISRIRLSDKTSYLRARPATITPGLIKSVVEGPVWLTGGDFGLESSMIAVLLCTTTGVVQLILAIRRGNIIRPF